MNISGVILAGGQNRRFGGKSKMDILVDGKTIISRIIETINEFFDEIIIVTKPQFKLTGSGDQKIVKDIFMNAGPAGGLHAGIQSSSKDAVFLFAGDMPFLDKNLITKQIDLYRDNKCDAVIPLLKNKPEPLHSIYSVSILPYLEKFLQEHDDYAMTSFITLITPYYMKVEKESPESRSFININYPSDLDAIRKLI